MASSAVVQSSPWSTIAAVREFGSLGGDYPDALIANFLRAATDVLFMHSGQQFNGGLQDTVRPCRQNSCLSLEFNYYPSTSSYGDNGPIPFQGSQSCGCDHPSEIEFDNNPIISVDSVIIDGVVRDPSTYRLDDHRWLVDLSAKGWPSCQYLALPVTAVGTWAVTYTWGRLPPEAGVIAVNQLAYEFTKAAAGERCNLPARATRLTRQGVSVQFQDIRKEDERTGLYFVDLFLRTYNPQGLRSETFIWSPDIPKRGRHVSS